MACAGGVVEGAVYEIGALNALEEAIAGTSLHQLDMYVGVSSGALITSFLANGISAYTLSKAVIGRAEDTLNVRPEVLFTPALREYAGRLSRLPRTLVSTLAQYALNPTDISLFGLLTKFGSVVPVGVFDNERIERFVRAALSAPGRTNDFRRLAPDFRVVTMHLDSAEVVCFGDAGHDHIPISKAIQASTALPGLYCPVEIEGEYYIDGVARRTVHASVALDLGADLLFCINPIVPVNIQLEQQVDRLFNDSLMDHGLPSVLSQTFRAIIDSRKRTGFKKYAHTHPGADLILIEPEYDDTRLFFSNIFSFSNRQEICEHAYQATRRHLLSRADELEPVLERHGLRLNRDVLTDQSRTLYPAPSQQSRTVLFEETDHVLDRLDRVITRLERDAA